MENTLKLLTVYPHKILTCVGLSLQHE